MVFKYLHVYSLFRNTRANSQFFLKIHVVHIGITVDYGVRDFYFSTAILNIVLFFCVWEMISHFICYIFSVIYVKFLLLIFFLQVIQLILEAELEM